jgi:anti-sigma B factor antagonist
VRFLLEVTRIGDLLDIVDEDPGFELDDDGPSGPPSGGAPTPAGVGGPSAS